MKKERAPKCGGSLKGGEVEKKIGVTRRKEKQITKFPGETLSRRLKAPNREEEGYKHGVVKALKPEDRIRHGG